MAKQSATPAQTAATPLASESATANQSAIGDRIADELVEAIEFGIDADHYCTARGAGATHAECLTIWKDQFREFSNYAETRQAGTTHAEAIEVVERAANLRHYTTARQHGATHDECLGMASSSGHCTAAAAYRAAGLS